MAVTKLVNEKSMDGRLMSSKERIEWGNSVHGIHGASKERRGIKKGANVARRLNTKKLILDFKNNVSEDN